MKTVALIVAAGRGTRAGPGAPKQWRTLAGRRVIDWTLDAFDLPGIVHRAVVIHPDDAALAAALPAQVIHGGATRAESVRNGLEALADQGFDAVLIHDAARATTPPEVISAVIDALAHGPAAAPALPVTDALWTGADMLALGVSSFGYLTDADGGGMHYQNQHDIVPYTSAVTGGDQPMYRALPIDAEEALIREWVLQLKLGKISRKPFIDKFGVDPFEKWADVLKEYADNQLIKIEGDEITIPRQTLLRIDTLLVAFFKPEHRGVRYA